MFAFKADPDRRPQNTRQVFWNREVGHPRLTKLFCKGSYDPFPLALPLFDAPSADVRSNGCCFATHYTENKGESTRFRRATSITAGRFSNVGAFAATSVKKATADAGDVIVRKCATSDATRYE